MNLAAISHLVASVRAEVADLPPLNSSVPTPPCPLCSYVERVDGRPDKLVAPTIRQGQHSGKWITSPCCALSLGIAPALTREEALAEWAARRLDWSQECEANRNKVEATIARLERDYSA